MIVFEHKALYGTKQDVPKGEQYIPLGRASVVRPGHDITLIGLSVTVGICLKAADELAGGGIDAEVIDLRTLIPMDAAGIPGSVRKTGRVVLAEENPGQLGWAAGVAAIIAEDAVIPARSTWMCSRSTNNERWDPWRFEAKTYYSRLASGSHPGIPQRTGVPEPPIAGRL